MDPNRYWLDRTRDHREYLAAWNGLIALTGDPVQETEGEVWQYMGSGRWDATSPWTHSFRHREAPAPLNQRTVHIPASPGWRGDK